MVKKLFKYEFMYYLKALLPYQIIIPITALVNRIIQLFETKTDIYNIIFGSSVFMFVASVIVSMVMAFVLAISRFYKNLFTSEGYLTLTLPVTATNHIFVKLTTAVTFVFATILNLIISLCIITSGEFLVEIIKAIGYLFKFAHNAWDVNLIWFILEAIVIILITITVSILLCYACISIGQLAKKNRVLMAFVAYFVYYVITQIIGTIFVVCTMIFNEQLEQLVRWITHNLKPDQIIHIGFWIGLIVYSLLSVLYFFISRTIISKKLNLE